MARPAREPWTSDDLRTRFIRWRRAGVCDRIMDSLAAANDTAVQIIDTPVVRVPQHAASIVRNWEQQVGRSRGGLTSKAHSVGDANGLPTRLGLAPGEAHDNRLCPVLLAGLRPRTMVLADRGCDAGWIMGLVDRRGARADIPPKQNRRSPICFSPNLYRVRNLAGRFFDETKAVPAHRHAL